MHFDIKVLKCTLPCHVAFDCLMNYPKQEALWLMLATAMSEIKRGAGGRKRIVALQFYWWQCAGRTEDNVMRSYRQRQQDNSISAIPTHTQTHTQTDSHMLSDIKFLPVCGVAPIKDGRESRPATVSWD